MESDFRGSKWDYYDKLGIVSALKVSGSVLDFGGGSGILAYQLRKLGYDAEVFELGKALAEISEGLFGLKTHHDLERLIATRKAAFDVIFAHHVLEHIDDLSLVFNCFSKLLADNGLIIVFVPNHGADQWKGFPGATLDSAHVCAFDLKFFNSNMNRFGFNCVTFSSPYAFRSTGQAGNVTQEGRGPELAMIAWKAGNPPPIALERWPYALPDLEDSVRAQAGC